MSQLGDVLKAIQSRKAQYARQCDAKAAGPAKYSNSWQRRAEHSRIAMEELSWVEGEIARAALNES